jgi:hypothetical protein
MSEEEQIVSKVLVHENDEQALSVLKDICTKNNLVGLKVCSRGTSIGLGDPSNEIGDVLNSNVDLGAIFLYEGEDLHGVTGLELCEKIHRSRPELPIFLRRDDLDSIDDLAEAEKQAIAGCYITGDQDRLQSLVEEYICSMYYPTEFAQGIAQVSEDAFNNVIPGLKVRHDMPYLVKDQIIYGELFSLIPLESAWCRGYMMLQTTESEVLDLIRSGRTQIKNERPTSTDSNNILNEVTNLIWGSIKSRYFANDHNDEETHRTQVPIMVNHHRKHISFGSSEPQLCFKYTLSCPNHEFPDIVLYQRLIFNLSWTPEKFEESDRAVDELINDGELEFF